MDSKRVENESDPIPLTSTEKAYLAGFCDGEGCFGVYSGHGILKIETTYEAYLERIGSQYGANVIPATKQQLHHKQAFAVKFMGQSLVQLLHDIYPYIVEKKDQVRTLMQFNAYKHGRGARTRLTDMDRRVYAYLERKLKAMKR